MADCPHKRVLVDYLGNWADARDCDVADLQVIAVRSQRPYMTLDKPRCGDCGKALTYKELRGRIYPGGDLYEAKFVWPEHCWKKWWWQWRIRPPCCFDNDD